MSIQQTLKITGITVLGGMLLAILSIAVSEVHSFDVFWQLQSGKYMWETGNFIRTDLFTLTADVPRYEHAWLHDLILYWTYLFAGYGGISVLKGILVFSTVATLAYTAYLRKSPWLSIVVALPLFLLTSGGWLERPQLWTFFIFSLFVLVLEVSCRRGSWHLLWVFPLAVFWANLHAGSILAIAIIVAYLVGSLVNFACRRVFDKQLFLKLCTAFGLIGLAAFITPYPDKLLEALLVSPNIGASVDSSGKATGSAMAVYNMDWTPTTFQQEPLFYYALGAVAIIMLLGWRRLNAADICLMLGLSFMGLKLVRHIPFFYMGAVAVLPAYLDAMIDPVKKRAPDIAKHVAWGLCIGCALWLFWYFWNPLYRIYGPFSTGLREWHYPIEATEFVEEHGLAKNIYNTYDWGGYMAWKLYPEYLMFWDGRQTSAEQFSLGWQAMAGHQGWEEIFERFDVNTVVSRSSTIDTGQKYPLLDRLYEHPDWFLVFNDESSMVFVKRGTMSRDWMKEYVRPKSNMDNTILSEAHLMVKVNPNRYMAWWGMSQIYLKRKQYKNALFALRQYLQRAPQRIKGSERLYQQLVQKVGSSAVQ